MTKEICSMCDFNRALQDLRSKVFIDLVAEVHAIKNNQNLDGYDERIFELVNSQFQKYILAESHLLQIHLKKIIPLDGDNTQ